MNYFKINYNKLENIPERKYFKLIIVFTLLICIILFTISKQKINEKFETYGIYTDNSLTININNKLSDKLKVSEYLVFNNTKTKFEIVDYGSYELINNEIYQEVTITMDKYFYQNEVGIVTFYYDKKTILQYIIGLFR